LIGGCGNLGVAAEVRRSVVRSRTATAASASTAAPSPTRTCLAIAGGLAVAGPAIRPNIRPNIRPAIGRLGVRQTSDGQRLIVAPN
jgi:hypothetical protein